MPHEEPASGVPVKARKQHRHMHCVANTIILLVSRLSTEYSSLPALVLDSVFGCVHLMLPDMSQLMALSRVLYA